jgi:hypothetical protein
MQRGLRLACWVVLPAFRSCNQHNEAPSFESEDGSPVNGPRSVPKAIEVTAAPKTPKSSKSPTPPKRHYLRFSPCLRIVVAVRGKPRLGPAATKKGAAAMHRPAASDDGR